MLQCRVVTGDNFRDGIGEIRGMVGRKIAFNDGRPAAGPGDNKVARLDCVAAVFGRGDKNKLNRLFDHLARRNMDVAAVEEKCLVQGGEGIAVGQREPAELLLEERGIRFQRGGEAGDFHSVRQFAHDGKPGLETPVHKNQS